MGIIRLKNITFNYDQQIKPIFNNINLTIDASWKLGLIGRNGRGKTTLMKIMQRQLKFSGEIETDLKFNYFPMNLTTQTGTVAEVIMHATNRDYSNYWEVEREFDQLDLPPNINELNYQRLSPGQKTKVMLATVFAEQATFQLLDEPTNHLDQSGRASLAKYLQGKAGFIVISHDRHFLNEVIDHVISIDRAQITLSKGNYGTWKTNFDQANATELKENRQLKKEIKQLQQASYQKQEWSRAVEKKKVGAPDKGFIGHKSAKMMGRALDIKQRADHKIQAKQQLLKNIEEDGVLSMNYEPTLTKRPLVEVENLIVARNEVQLNQLLNFKLKVGERIVLTGMNGVGKTTIIKALFDDQSLILQGSHKIRPNLKISYLSQNFDELSGTLADFAKEKQVQLQSLLAILRKLGFERSLFEVRLEQMSMGQKRKVALARSLCEHANLYVWDEPLNYLDVITREQIQKLILEYQPTMIIIDHDVDFTDAVGTKLIQVNRQ